MSASEITAQDLSGAVFLAFLAATVAGALVAVCTRRLVRAVAGLGLCFVGVAGLYWYLGSPFVALMQVLIYVGAVCVTIVFAVMLAESQEMKREQARDIVFPALGAVAGAALVWALAGLAVRTQWKVLPGRAGTGDVAELGRAFLTTFSLSFELISVVLLVAIVGSLALARGGRDRR